MNFPIEEEKIVNFRHLSSTSLRKIRERHPKLEEVDWDACKLPKYGNVEAPCSGVIKITNSYPAWKNMFTAQRREDEPFNFDMKIHGVDGYVPVHSVFLLYKVEWLTEAILDVTTSLEPPSQVNPINIILVDVSVDAIKAFVSMCCTGAAKVKPGLEKEIRNLLHDLKINKSNFQLSPLILEENPGEKFRGALVWRKAVSTNLEDVDGEPKPSTSVAVQLVPVAASSHGQFDYIPKEVRKVRRFSIPSKAQRVIRSLSIKEEASEIEKNREYESNLGTKSETDKMEGSIPSPKTMKQSNKKVQNKVHNIVNLKKLHNDDESQVSSHDAPVFEQQRIEPVVSSSNVNQLRSQQLRSIGNGVCVQKKSVLFVPRFLPRHLYSPRRVSAAPERSSVAPASAVLSTPKSPVVPFKENVASPTFHLGSVNGIE